MDDHSSDEGEDDDDDVNDLASNMASSVSSVSGQQHDGSRLGLAGMQVRTSLYDTESDVDTVVSERRHHCRPWMRIMMPNPMLNLEIVVMCRKLCLLKTGKRRLACLNAH